MRSPFVEVAGALLISHMEERMADDEDWTEIKVEVRLADKDGDRYMSLDGGNWHWIPTRQAS